MSDDALLAAAGRALGSEVAGARNLAGGDINRAWALELADGTQAFLKSRGGAPLDEYGAEAMGLRWLADAGGLRVPGVLAVIGEDDVRGLALDWIEPGALSEGGEEELGSGLALTHAAGADEFGALPPGSPRRLLRFGGVELPFGSVAGGSPWSRHYAARLDLLGQVAFDRGRISGDALATLERVVSQIDELAGPAEPPARVHGDLWSGNVLAGSDGRPWLIDPAAHGAHRELDLAMLELFGTVSARTLAAYEDVRALADGWAERVGLWQLQPLLVHAILFGGSYGAAVERTASRYV